MQNFGFLNLEDGTAMLCRSLGKSPEDRNSRLLRGGSVKSFP